MTIFYVRIDGEGKVREIRPASRDTPIESISSFLEKHGLALPAGITYTEAFSIYTEVVETILGLCTHPNYVFRIGGDKTHRRDLDIAFSVDGPNISYERNTVSDLVDYAKRLNEVASVDTKMWITASTPVNDLSDMVNKVINRTLYDIIKGADIYQLCALLTYLCKNRVDLLKLIEFIGRDYFVAQDKVIAITDLSEVRLMDKNGYYTRKLNPGVTDETIVAESMALRLNYVSVELTGTMAPSPYLTVDDTLSLKVNGDDTKITAEFLESWCDIDELAVHNAHMYDVYIRAKHGALYNDNGLIQPPVYITVSDITIKYVLLPFNPETGKTFSYEEVKGSVDEVINTPKAPAPPEVTNVRPTYTGAHLLIAVAGTVCLMLIAYLIFGGSCK